MAVAQQEQTLAAFVLENGAAARRLLAEIEKLFGRFPPFSDEREEFLVALYGTSETLRIDGESGHLISLNGVQDGFALEWRPEAGGVARIKPS